MYLEEPNGSSRSVSDLQIALSAFLTSEHLTSMIILGPVGTGKSTVMHALEKLGEKVVYVPPGTTDDRLFGSTDIELTLKAGKTVYEKGLVDEAGNGILFVDDIDLMDKTSILQLLNRFGCESPFPESSHSHGRIIATTSRLMIYEDKLFMNRFDICAMVRTPTETERITALKNFVNNVENTNIHDISAKVRKARAIMDNNPKLLSRHTRAISMICRDEKVRGQSGPLACARTAVALAALEGRKKTSDDDIIAATLLCIRHRVNPPKEKIEKKDDEIERMYENRDILRFIHDDRKKNVNTSIVDKINAPSGSTDDVEPTQAVKKDDEDEEDAIISKVGKALRTYDISEIEDMYGKKAEESTLRFVESSKGKYSGFRTPKGECTDLAFDATVRAAAPYQKSRNPDGHGIIIEKQDLREKVRMKHISHTFYFMIDASGSLLIRNRMSRVKATVISMLETHYVKRDRVGIMTFNENEMCVLMQPTKAVEELTQSVEQLKVGCGTPLSAALMFAWNEINSYRRKHPEEIMHIIMMTDGKATKALDEDRDPCEEALEIAKHLHSESVDWTIVDTGLGASKTDMPQKLAESLDGRLFMLDQLESRP